MAGYRGPLKKLFDDAKVPFQFVGSWTDNPGGMPLPREQQHHEGHSGYVIIGGTSGRAGIYDSRQEWLGPMGSEADVFLIVIGTNDVDLRLPARHGGGSSGRAGDCDFGSGHGTST